MWVVVESKPTWDNSLRDPQRIVLRLGVICVRFIYVCEVPREIGCIFLKRYYSFEIENKESHSYKRVKAKA